MNAVEGRLKTPILDGPCTSMLLFANLGLDRLHNFHFKLEIFHVQVQNESDSVLFPLSI